MKSATARFERLAQSKEYADRKDIQDALAKCYFKQGRTNDAKQIYINQMRINPRDADVWVRLGEIAWSEGDLTGSLKAATQVMSLEPTRHEG